MRMGPSRAAQAEDCSELKHTERGRSAPTWHTPLDQHERRAAPLDPAEPEHSTFSAFVRNDATKERSWVRTDLDTGDAMLVSDPDRAIR